MDSSKAGLLARTAGLGIATGLRSSLGFSAPVLTDGTSSASRRAAAVAGIAGELVADKLPRTPSRLKPAALAGRVVAGAEGARLLARHGGASSATPVAAAMAIGAAAALVGSFAGANWRTWAAERLPGWRGAVIEDAVALLLAFGVCRVA